MATGRIGVTPVLRTRWSDQPTVGTTSLSGLDDNSVSLVYDVGYEAVYRNGVLLSRGNDYTATDGTTVTLTDATLAGDIIEIFANELVPLTDAISKGQYNAKGALLSATAASTPGVLAVGANDTVLTADSTEATGLKWATPAAGGMTLISTTTFAADATVTLSSIPATYKDLKLVFRNLKPSNNMQYVFMRFNGATAGYTTSNSSTVYGLDNSKAFGADSLHMSSSNNSTTAEGLTNINIYDYTNSTTWKLASVNSIGNGSTATDGQYSNFLIAYNGTSAISSITIFRPSGTITSGTMLLYGVK